MTINPETAEFEAAILRGFDEGSRSVGRRTAPEQLAAGRRGRPVGSVKAVPKVPTTIRFDRDVLDALKASGRGWQTRVNAAMREWLGTHSKL